MSVTVVTAIFGEGHLPYLWALLESLGRLGYGASDVVVACSGLPPEAQTRLDARCRCVQFDCEPIPDPRRSAQAAGKLDGWSAALGDILDVEGEGQNVAFLDSDTFVVKRLDGAFAGPFDVATTWRNGGRWRMNSGVVFARASTGVWRWMESWGRAARETIGDSARHESAVAESGAADQATLLSTLDATGLHHAKLPMSVWNETSISRAPDDVAIWHMKGALQALRIGKHDHRADQPSYRLWLSTIKACS